MVRVIIACFITACGLLPRQVAAQASPVQQYSNVQTGNAHLMDSLEMEVVTIWCHGQLDYPMKYSRHKTDQVTRILVILNSLYSDTLSRRGLAAGIGRFPRKHVSVDTVLNGGDSVRFVVKVDMPDYLVARLTFTCLGDRVVAQRYELQPETKIWANDHHQAFVDFNYCKTVYAPALSFPVHYVRNEYFYASLRL
jgi:hypothetical protein